MASSRTNPKRSITLPPELDAAVEAAAAREGSSVSAWLAASAAHRLGIDAGWEGVDAWEADHGRLTAAELAEGRARARAVLAAAEAAAATGSVVAPGSSDAATDAEHPVRAS
jgi:hypothetical protein